VFVVVVFDLCGGWGWVGVGGGGGGGGENSFVYNFDMSL